MVTSELLSTFRRIMFAITGLTCLAYAVLALLQMRPDPFPFWIPGILGLISAALNLPWHRQRDAKMHNRLLTKVTSWTNAALRHMRFGLH